MLGLALIAAPSASAKKVVQGGISSTGLESEIPESTEAEIPVEAETGEIETGESGPVGRARLVGTRAVAPADAPLAVKRVIAAANRIRTTPYIWGGGHRRWQDTGYDCSGSVSFVLAAAGLLSGPLASGPLMSWGEPGKGKWVTIWTNPGHVFLEVAGIRFDTSAQRITGSRWINEMRSTDGFVARHPAGL
jgi:hypothetical protein